MQIHLLKHLPCPSPQHTGVSTAIHSGVVQGPHLALQYIPSGGRHTCILHAWKEVANGGGGQLHVGWTGGNTVWTICSCPPPLSHTSTLLISHVTRHCWLANNRTTSQRGIKIIIKKKQAWQLAGFIINNTSDRQTVTQTDSSQLGRGQRGGGQTSSQMTKPATCLGGSAGSVNVWGTWQGGVLF